MRHTKFTITNFRGIADVTLSLESRPRTKVFTLVGLNESGKTTILEAINSFTRRIDLDPLDLPGYAKRDPHELIPISKRSNFNGTIAVQVEFACDAEDEKAIADFARQLGVSLSAKVGRFVVETSYAFKNSKVLPEQPSNLWTIDLVTRKRGARKPKSLEANDEWQKIVSFIRDRRLPNVVYFPNFLFELPDRVYLEAGGEDDKKHEFYRAVLQDVLDAIGEQTNIADHILGRAKSGTPPDKQSLESVLMKMGTHITQTVFSSWNRIFKRVPGKKEIIVNIDQDQSARWYLQLRLKDGSDLYSISERSLGFRWFFAFLLLTQYRGFRRTGPRGALFLFDEPASNLHPSAQAQLLESFGRFPDHAPIIYTTHSHHMVNPDWLEGTYVVKNEGLDYNGTSDEYNSNKTLITLHRYRSFAAAHPNQSTYFQPILDVLAYQPSKLENVPQLAMIEGKNDFYALRVMQQQLGHPSSLYMLPGSGAGSLVDVLRLYIGWGRTFVVLLDADSEGERQRARYLELFGKLVEDSISTLSDVDEQWDQWSTEDLFSEEDRLAIQKAAFPDSSGYEKILFNRGLQEMLVSKTQVAISKETMNRFSKVLAFLSARLENLTAD